jgi:hypothetical protein
MVKLHTSMPRYGWRGNGIASVFPVTPGTYNHSLVGSTECGEPT